MCSCWKFSVVQDSYERREHVRNEGRETSRVLSICSYSYEDRFLPKNCSALLLPPAKTLSKTRKFSALLPCSKMVRLGLFSNQRSAGPTIGNGPLNRQPSSRSLSSFLAPPKAKTEKTSLIQKLIAKVGGTSGADGRTSFGSSRPSSFSSFGSGATPFGKDGRTSV